MPPWRLLRPGYLGTEADRATLRTLRTATQLTSVLRTGLTAWYTSFAGVTAFTWGRQVFPVGLRE